MRELEEQKMALEKEKEENIVLISSEARSSENLKLAQE